MTKGDLCRGCRDDYYNRIGGCWHFRTSAIVIRTAVGTWDNPPYTWKPTRTLSCHRPDGQHWLQFEDCRFEHNWKDPLAAGGGR